MAVYLIGNAAVYFGTSLVATQGISGYLTDGEADDTFEQGDILSLYTSTGLLLKSGLSYLGTATINGLVLPVLPTSTFLPSSTTGDYTTLVSPDPTFTFPTDPTSFTYSATATLTLTPPTKNANTGLALAEGGTATIKTANLDFNDEQVDARITYTVTAAATNGTLYLNTTALGVGSTFTQDDINNNRLTYTHDSTKTPSASFEFSVADFQGSIVSGQTFEFTVTLENNAHTGNVTVTGTPTENQTLTANTSTLADPDGLGAFKYQWQRDGVNIPSATFSTYKLGDADVGSAIRVIVTYMDQGGVKETITSAATASVGGVNDAPTFASGDGSTTIPSSTSSDIAETVLLLPDGRILLAGTQLVPTGQSAISPGNFALASFNPDGSLDTSFGGGDGIATTDFGGVSTNINASAVVAPDGSIYLVGMSILTTNFEISVAKYTSTGILDTSFGGGDGLITTSIGNGGDLTAGATVQPDGKLIVVATSRINGLFDVTAVRYTADGVLDTTFGGGDGIVSIDLGGGLDAATSVTLAPDGKIVIVGVSSASPLAVIRLTASGALDTSFGGGDGVVAVPVNNFVATPKGVTVQPDGRILVAGTSQDSFATDSQKLMLLRYTSAGNLDQSFGGGDGIVALQFDGFRSNGNSVFLLPDGRILVAGTVNDAVALACFTSTGNLDTSFGGGDGFVTTSIGAAKDEGFSVTVQPDGRILVGGQAASSDINALSIDFALLRFNSDGSLDQTFDTVNTLNGSPAYTEDGTPVVLDSSVKIYDVELASSGNYAGATLTLERHAGASSEDLFGASGPLSTLTEGGNLVVSNVTIGTVTQNSGGKLILTFNANATQTLVDTALSAITYANSSDTPPAAVTIDWTFSDGNTSAQGSGGALAATGSTVITITAVNDAPTGEPTKTLASGTEDQTYTVSAADLLVGITDPDGDTLSISSLDASVGTVTDNGNGTYTITQAANFNGPVTLTYSVTDGAAPLSGKTRSFTINSVNDAPSGANKTITTNEDTPYTFKAADFGFSDIDGDSLKSVTITALPVAGTLKLNGVAVSAGQVIAAASIGSLVFTPAANANGTAYTTFKFAVSDTGGTAYGGIDTDATANAITFNVTPVNDAPTADAAITAQTTLEDAAFTFTVPPRSFADVDVGDTLSYAATQANGSALPGWLTFNAATKTFTGTPANGDVGTISVKVTATDGKGVSASQTFNVTVGNVNDAPSGQNKTITTNEDTAYAFKVADFAMGDIENNALKAIKIGSLPTAGTLTLNGVAVAANQVIAAADITKLVFKPSANANGTAYANFTFFVQDTGGTANGGIDADATPNTITLNVTPVNDAPAAVVATNVHGSIAENTSTASAIKFADLAITDVDGGNNVLSLAGADASLFQIVNGDLYLKAGAKLDFETNPKLDVTVIVNDASVGGAIDAQTALSFAVTDTIENNIGTGNADTLVGGNYDETFTGGAGADKMTGGGGRDTFVFKALTDTAPGSPSFITNPTIAWQAGLGLRDIITDFTPGIDKIDLSAIDASTKLAGNQAFAFNGTGTFAVNPGSLIYRVFDLAGTANDRTIVYADVNGDKLADMQIELTGLKALQATDFVL